MTLTITEKELKDHMLDLYFELYVLGPNIQSIDDVEALAARLEQDSAGCVKAREIRECIKNVNVKTIWQWTLFPELSRIRRTCCLCHETGSFSKSTLTFI